MPSIVCVLLYDLPSNIRLDALRKQVEMWIKDLAWTELQLKIAFAGGSDSLGGSRKNLKVSVKVMCHGAASPHGLNGKQSRRDGVLCFDSSSVALKITLHKYFE